MPGVLMVEALAQAGAVAVLSEPANSGQARSLRRHRRRALQAHRPTRRRPRARMRARADAGAGRKGDGEGHGRGRARRAGNANVRSGGRSAAGQLTGCSAAFGPTPGSVSPGSARCLPEGVLANAELADRLGVTAGVDLGTKRHRRAPRGRRGARASRRSPPGRRRRLSTMAGLDPASLDLVIVATATPELADTGDGGPPGGTARRDPRGRATTSRRPAPASSTPSPRRTPPSRPASPSAALVVGAEVLSRRPTGTTG